MAAARRPLVIVPMLRVFATFAHDLALPGHGMERRAQFRLDRGALDPRIA